MYQYGYQVKYTVDRISPNDENRLGDFDCGNDEINEYIHSKCFCDSHCVTYLFKDENQCVIGFSSLCCSSIDYEFQNVITRVPSIEIKYFALDKSFQKMKYFEEENHYYLSDEILAVIIDKCRKISEEVIGAQWITLYSVPDKVNFYVRNLFEDFTEFMRRSQEKYLEGCRPMYLKLD